MGTRIGAAIEYRKVTTDLRDLHAHLKQFEEDGFEVVWVIPVHKERVRHEQTEQEYVLGFLLIGKKDGK